MLEHPWFLETLAGERLEGLRHEAEVERQLREARSGEAPEAESRQWREAFPGVEFRLMAGGPEMMIAVMRFQKGASAELHRHGCAQAGYVLEGRLRVTLEGEQLTIAAGQCYLLPPDLPHQVRALDRSVVLDFFAPGQSGFDAVVGQAETASARIAAAEERLAPSGARRRARAAGSGRRAARCGESAARLPSTKRTPGRAA